MRDLINIEREARGLPRFVHVPELTEVARKHSQVMMERGKVSHEADGTVFQERLEKAVTNACRFGENITKHYTIEYAVADLMGSPGHRGNLLDTEFTGIGIGIARNAEGLLYITQDFVSYCEEKEKPQAHTQDGGSFR